jgi:RND superfamily putative drug exporter
MDGDRAAPRQRVGRDRGTGTPLERFGQSLARHSRPVLSVWAVLLVAGAILLPRFEDRLTGPPFDVNGSQSQHAQAMLEDRFDRPSVEQDLIVFRSDVLTVDDPAFRRVVTAADDAVLGHAFVTEVIGPYDPEAMDQVSADRQTAVSIVMLGGSSAERQHAAPEIAAAARVEATDDVGIFVTGKSLLIDDLVAQEHADLARAERLGLPAALVILLLVSGSLVSATLPLLLAGVGIVVAFGILGAATRFMSFHLFVPNIATMLGLGVGIDYALLIVTRFREQMAQRDEPVAAATNAVASAGRTICFSGATVVLSLSGLFAVNAPIFRQLALGAIVAVAVMIAGAVTLLPAVLVTLGRRVEWLTLPLPRYWLGHTATPDSLAARWARLIMRRPVIAAIGASAVLLALAFPVTGLRLGLSTGTDELTSRPAAQGRAILEHNFNAGAVAPITVVVTSRDGPLDEADLDAVDRLTKGLGADGQAAQVTSISSVLDRIAGGNRSTLLNMALSLPQARSSLGELVNIGRGEDTAVIFVVPKSPPDHDAATAFVRRIRHSIVPAAIDRPSVDVAVGGLSAQIVDITDESSRKLPLVALLVVGFTFPLLAAAFRSLVLPLKAILMNLLSFVAAYGLIVLVFQQGVGARFLHVTKVDATQVYLPLLTFAILFGLSMDYEVFLLGRIQEAMAEIGDNARAVAAGLAQTASVITGAAAIMVTVFAAFTLVRLREVQELGFSLAAAVFLDATLVRLILVPATMELLGHWNWWFPRWLDRLVPPLVRSPATSVTSRVLEGTTRLVPPPNPAGRSDGHVAEPKRSGRL